jgi:hypothetical protein
VINLWGRLLKQYNIDGFIKLVENNEFVEAHEVLEDDWKALKKAGEKKTAKYLQALINGATALALFIIKKREDAGNRVWDVYVRNKHLFDEIELHDRDKYIYTMKLLEDKYSIKDEL